MLPEIESLHTAARRYCMERADMWRAKNAEIAKRLERPAKSGLLKKLGLTVTGSSREADATYPRYQILDAILVEIERAVPTDFTSIDNLRTWLATTSRAVYDEEARPPDMVFSKDDLMSAPHEFYKRIAHLGPKAKIVGGKESSRSRDLRLKVMQEEVDAFVNFVSAWTGADSANVKALPYRRTLRDDESEKLRSALKSRWGVDGEWYPLDRGRDEDPPPNTVAFQAEPFFDKRVVGWLHELLRRQSVRHVYELREGTTSADYEIDLELLRPWYNFEEGYWFDESTDWLIYASHEGSVTLGGAVLIAGLQSVWRNWDEYIYADAEAGVERQVGPGVWSTSVAIEPPPGWDPPSGN